MGSPLPLRLKPCPNLSASLLSPIQEYLSLLQNIDLMNYLKIILISISILVVSCQPQATTQEESHSPPEEERFVPANVPASLERTWEAHGGLDPWYTYQTLEYDLEVVRGEEGEGAMQHSVIDLKSRRERITYDEYEIGYDGQDFWYMADSIPAEHPEPRFYINLQFYFFALPFVLADPGITYEDLGKRPFDGKDYDVVKVGYKEGVGEAPEDQYLLYLDPDTHRLHLLLYSVTYFNAENATRYNAAIYEDWQEVYDLWVPRKMTSHQWDAEAEQIGEVRYIKTFSDVRFSTEAPAAELFHKPEGAEVSE